MKEIVTAVWYSKVLQGRGTSVFKFQKINVNCLSPQLEIQFPFLLNYFHVKALSKRIFDQQRMKMVIPLCYTVVLSLFFFVEFKKGLASFLNDFIFISETLITLCRFKLGFHCLIEVFYFFLKLNSVKLEKEGSNFV